MAIVAGVGAGQAPMPLNGTTTEALRLGASASITTSAASAAANIPADANSVKYGSLLIYASATAWFNFNTAGDAAVAGAANTYLLVAGVPLLVVPPPTATQVSAIQDAAAGKVMIIGIM